MIAAAQSFEQRLHETIAAVDRNLLNFTEYSSTPLKVIATISVFRDDDEAMESDGDFLVEGLYSLGKFSDVDSIAFYIPQDSSGVLKWVYTYSAEKNAVVGLNHQGEVSLFSPNNWDAFDRSETVRLNLFPETCPEGTEYSLTRLADGSTSVEIRRPFVNKEFIYGHEPGEAIGSFVIRKRLASSWEELDRQMGVNFTVYDVDGAVKGGWNPMPDLDIAALPADSRGLETELLDEDGNVYDSFLTPLLHNDRPIGFLSTNIAQSATTLRIKETSTFLAFITLLMLLIITGFSLSIVARFFRPIKRMTEAATAMARGDLDRQIEVWSRDEMGTLAQAFADMRDAIKAKIVELNNEVVERERAEWAVRKLNEDLEMRVQERTEELCKLVRAVEQSPAYIVITDSKGNIEYVNPHFLEVTGYSAEEALGQNPRILKSGRTGEDAYKQMWETILAGDTWQGEFLNKKKNGEFYWASISISPVVDGEGSVSHFVSVHEDTTDRKEAEIALQEAKQAAEAANQSGRVL